MEQLQCNNVQTILQTKSMHFCMFDDPRLRHGKKTDKYASYPDWHIPVCARRSLWPVCHMWFATVRPPGSMVVQCIIHGSYGKSVNFKESGKTVGEKSGKI